MSRVDFMTIAKWVGHSGCNLISKVYGHLSNEHAQRAAKKVTFGNGGTGPQPGGMNTVNPRDLSVEELRQILKEKMVKESF